MVEEAGDAARAGKRDHELKLKWSSVAYSVVGMGAEVDDALDFALSLVLGRDGPSVGVLYERVAPTLSADKKLSILRDAVHGDAAAADTLAAAETVLRARNALAHSVVAEVTESSALFESRYRGKEKAVRLWDVEAWLLRWGQNRLMRDMWCLAVRHSDPWVVGQVHGFLDE